LATCAEYLAFMDDSGYTRPELWLSEGWTTIREEGWQAPLYWQRDPGTESGWKIFTLLGWQPLETLSETPVCHISFFEADAFARWAARNTPGTRLPTEFEWEHAASSLRTQMRGAPHHPQLLTSPEVAGTEAAAVATPANLLESAVLHPTTARTLPGLQQIFGDVWEWTSSGYTGYPGYRPLPGALGEYNGKFMSSQVILRGGSCVTPATHIRATYRNFFSPRTRWQFSGLRLAREL
jgi:ergothioneine biosynthesis protein EgtB